MFEVIEFRAWRRWFEDLGRCQATTARGRQCKNGSHPLGYEVCSEDDFHRVEFVMGVTDCCHLHQKFVPHLGHAGAATIAVPG